MEERRAYVSVSPEYLQERLVLPYTVIGANWDWATWNVRLFVAGPSLRRVPRGSPLPMVSPEIDADKEVEAMCVGRRRELLTALLAEATTAGEDFSEAEKDVLVAIGKGMFWNERLDRAARGLAEDVRIEFESTAPYICGDRDPS